MKNFLRATILLVLVAAGSTGIQLQAGFDGGGPIPTSPGGQAGRIR